MPTSKPILCGSIAGTIGGTGVLMHNAAYRAAGLPFTYVSFQPSGAKAAIEAMRCLGIRGLGVSMPYKIEVMDYLDRLDSTARDIGAVNTVVNDDGVLTGHNTDWLGAIDGLKEVTSLPGRSVALFGAGGAARAICYGLAREGASVTVFNRDRDRGAALAREFGATFGGDAAAYDTVDGYSVIVNATSVGFGSDETILTRDRFVPGTVVLDVVFKPFHTRFAAEAAAAGCTVVPGYRMLILQAMAQAQLYTGRRVPYEAMEQALLSSLAGEAGGAVGGRSGASR